MMNPNTPAPAGNSSATAAHDNLWVSLYQIYRWMRFGVSLVSSLFVVVLLLELTRTYTWAFSIHPVLGYLVGAAMLALVGTLLGVPIYWYLRMPRVVDPPDLPDSGAVLPRHLQAEIQYLDRYLNNCAGNVELADKQNEISKARAELTAWKQKVGQANSGNVPALNQELTQWVNKNMSPILSEVDQKADRIIYQEALALGISTAITPNGTLDAFLMLWRSINLVSRLSVLYYGRPGVLGTINVCRDVAVATTLASQTQNVAQSLGNLVANSASGMAGMLAGPTMEGVTNALVMIRIGYLAKERCRSFREWNTENQQSAILASLDATRKVAVGLASEMLRQLGIGLGAVVNVAAAGVGQVANDALSALGGAAGAAVDTARNWGQALGSAFTGAKKPGAANTT